MGCLKSFIGFVLYLFNLALALCGIAIIVTGSLMAHGLSTGFTDYISAGSVAPPAVFITIGCIVFIVAFFGCCGAKHKAQWMLYTYAGIMIALFVAELVIGIYVLVKWDGVDFTSDLHAFFKADNLKFQGEFQEYWECCGVIGPLDYVTVGQLVLPPTCCADGKCNYPLLTNNNYDGCAIVLNDWFSTNSEIIGWVAIGFAVVELFAVISSCVVAQKHK